jgi:hypothetical protein
MATEREVLLNLWKYCNAKIYQWNTYDPYTGGMVLRVYEPLPGRVVDTAPNTL